MKNKNFAKFEIVCYVAAAVLAVIAVYMLYANIAYISTYLTAYGMTFADMKSDIIQTVLSTLAPYFTYAFVVFGIGKIYHAVAMPKAEAVVEEVVAEEAEAVETVEVVEAEVVEAVEVEADEQKEA